MLYIQWGWRMSASERNGRLEGTAREIQELILPICFDLLWVPKTWGVLSFWSYFSVEAMYIFRGGEQEKKCVVYLMTN